METEAYVSTFAVAKHEQLMRILFSVIKMYSGTEILTVFFSRLSL